MIPQGYNTRIKPVTFIEGEDGVYRAKNGYRVEEIPATTEPGNDIPRWRMFDNHGHVVGDDMYTLVGFTAGFPCVFQTYQQRYGRKPGLPKWSPSHLKPGYRVRVKHPSGGKIFDLTVGIIGQNGPRSFYFVSEELNEHGVRHSFNVAHLEEILDVSGGRDEKMISDDSVPTTVDVDGAHNATVESIAYRNFTMPRLKKGERIFYTPWTIIRILVFADKLCPEHNHGQIRSDLSKKFVRNLNLGRDVFLRSSIVPMNPRQGPDEDTLWIINVKKLRKWLKNNAHRVFTTLNELEKFEQQEYERAEKLFEETEYDT